MKSRSMKAFYPIIFGIYPVIGLLSVNISETNFLDGLRSICVTIVFSILVYVLFRWLIKDKHKAAMICAWFFLMFFSYGHVYDILEGRSLFDLVLGRHRFLFPFWLLISGIGIWLLIKTKVKLSAATRILNITCLVLLLIPFIQIGIYEWKRNHPISGISTSVLDQFNPGGVDSLPDIYYIIPDGYMRDDFLLQNYQLNNGNFIHQLEEMGFYVPRCSQSNYSITVLSLSSSLNMDYVDTFIPLEILEENNKAYLENYIKDNRLRQIFKEMGYTIISFENGFAWAEWRDADFFFEANPNPYSKLLNFQEMSGFETLYLRTTFFRVLDEAKGNWITQLLTPSTIPHRQRVMSALDNLGSIPQMEEPTFTYLHLISPHEPFIFNPDGEFTFTEKENPGYPDQVQYLNTRLLSLMQHILDQSSVSPIIIIQSDHGRENQRLANFTALYFPGEDKSSLYPTLTPVNIFRLVLNTYFGQNYPLLPDTSYYTYYEDYSDFNETLYSCDSDR